MILEVNFDSDIPIYNQIIRQIIIGIAEKKLSLGEKLPSVRLLAEDIGVNMHTVNKAYQELRAMGYVKIDRRKGASISNTIPEFNDDNKEFVKDELDYLIADILNRGVDEEGLIEIIEDRIKRIRGE